MSRESTKIPSLKAQSAWLLFAKTAGFGFAFMLPLLVVRYLDQSQVGIYRQSFLVVGNASVILSFGFAMSAYYYLSREEENRAPAIFNILLFHFITGGAACLTLVFFPQLLGAIFNSDEMTALAPEIGAVIWVWIFSSILETVAIANREPKHATAFIIFAQLGKTLLMSAAVILFHTVEAFLHAALIQGTLQSVVLLIYLNTRFPGFWRAFDRKFFRAHFAYAVPFGLAGILWILMSDIHNYFVGYRFSNAEYAIYAYGCFEIPLIASLTESITSVLIPRMSELEMRGERAEMIRLTARAMQKLAFVFFPLYVFLFITADTFITTLFTTEYLASVPIYRINLTMLLMLVFVTDPIVRAFPELGRFLLKLRIVLFIVMITALYFGIQHFSLNGMIAIVVAVTFVEKVISETFVVRKLELKLKDLALLKNVGKAFVVSALTGALAFAVYYFWKDDIAGLAGGIAQKIVPRLGGGLINFISGASVLAFMFSIFAPIYLVGMNFAGAIDEQDKDLIRNIWDKLRRKKREMQEENDFFAV